jgi:hypothetical protein
MTVDPLKILAKRIRAGSWTFFALMNVYIGLSLFLVFQWVAPSLDGRTDQRVPGGSATYLKFANTLATENIDPYVIATLSSLTTTALSPVLLSFGATASFASLAADDRTAFQGLRARLSPLRIHLKAIGA